LSADHGGEADEVSVAGGTERFRGHVAALETISGLAEDTIGALPKLAVNAAA
jgi:hypothetical protein